MCCFFLKDTLLRIKNCSRHADLFICLFSRAITDCLFPYFQRVEFVCKYILQSMTSDNVKVMYVSLLLNKQLVLPWIQQLKRLLCLCCDTFRYLKVTELLNF